MRRLLCTLLSCSVLLAGCKAKEAFDKASAERELSKKGTLDVMKEAANDKYRPPADGKLTDAQVQIYLKVREKEKLIAQAARQQAQQHADASKKAGEKSLSGMMESYKTLGSVADLMTADIRAAKDLGYNTAEYTWIKGQILAASGSAYAEKLSQAANASIDSMYANAKKSFDEAKDPESKKMYGEMLASLEKSKQEQQQSKAKEDPAVSYNRQLLSKYENTLNALTNELAKFEDKAGEAQKGMKEFEQNVDKAVQDAKKQQ